MIFYIDSCKDAQKVDGGDTTGIQPYLMGAIAGSAGFVIIVVVVVAVCIVKKKLAARYVVVKVYLLSDITCVSLSTMAQLSARPVCS